MGAVTHTHQHWNIMNKQTNKQAHIGPRRVLLPDPPRLHRQAMAPTYNKEDAGSSSSSAGVADLSFVLVKSFNGVT